MQPLTAEDVARYRQDGIIIPPKGLGPQTVEALRAKLDQFLADQKITDADYVLDLSKRKRHLVRGVDRSGRNDVYRAA